MAKTAYLNNKVLDHTLGTTAYTMPSMFLALFIGDPAGAGVEVSGGGYARKAVAFGAAAGGTALSTGVITFPVATTNWGAITHAALFDAVTAGNQCRPGAFTTTINVTANDQVVLADQALTVTEG